MSNILINQLWLHKKNKYRIVYTSQELDLIIWIEVGKENVYPEEINFEFFNQVLQNNEITEVKELSPFIDIDSLDEKSSIKLEKSWTIIRDIVKEEPLIYDKKYFNRICKDQAVIHGVSRQTIARLILRYWQNGKTKLSIVPKYYNSGGKGKEKNLKKAINGRQRIDKKTSIILDQSNKLKIKKGYNRWYLKVKLASKRVAYHSFLRVAYKAEWKSRNFTNVPSFAQFCYWGEKDLSTEEKLRSKKGNVIFDKDLRITEGSSSNSVNGPGLSQIDSTPSDMELVSAIDGKTPIGCPTIYIISDVYSAMYLGVLITLENPSYVQAAEALYNSFSNKAKFFERSLLYQFKDFDLNERDWPCEYIPHSIVADRGIELIGKNSENLIEDLGIHIENKESYRPELKGMIENQFQILHKDLKGLDEGIGMKDKDDGRRGARKARKTAKFTLREYLAIIVRMMVKNNKTHKLTNFPLDREMPLAEMYAPTPQAVFDWGIKNKGGKLRSNNIENLKERMLPRDTAYLTKKGVEFQKGWYILPLNHKLRDLQLKTQKKKVKVSVSYDPYNLNQINILHEGEVIECKLNISKSPIYKDKTMWDIIHLKKARSESINQNNDELTYATINDLEFAANLLKDRKEGVTINKTGSKSVKENREKDKKIGREFKRKESVAKELENRKNGKIISINTKINLDQPDDLDFIDRLLDEE